RSAGGHHAHGAPHGLDEVSKRAEWRPLDAHARALILMPPPRVSTRAQSRRWLPLRLFRLGDFMRPLTNAGILLIVFGAFVLLRGASLISRRDVLKVGDVQVTADEQQSIPPWAGWLSIVAGGAMAVAGARRRA